ncbi:MAG TPA: ADP-ribosylglycohydrolase family protein [Clostridia bacterium]|nr:ADP-ribosylglycohydrolase family protein [Clostridia bacterium]
MKRKVLRSLFCLIQGDSLGFTKEKNQKDDLLIQEGLWSDNTAMVIASLDAFSYFNGFSMMKNFVDIAEEGIYTARGYSLGMSETTKEALRRFQRGVHPFACGGKKDSDNDNDALVRTWPLALYAMKKFDIGKEKEKALDFIDKMVACTHAHPRSLLLSRLYSELLWDLLKEGTSDQLRKSAHRIKRGYAEHPEWIYMEKALSGSYKNGSEGIDTFASMLDVLLCAGSFERAIRLALKMGGDTSSRAALVGSLAGLIYPDQPEDWMNIEKKEEIKSQLLGAWLKIL